MGRVKISFVDYLRELDIMSFVSAPSVVHVVLIARFFFEGVEEMLANSEFLAAGKKKSFFGDCIELQIIFL